MRLLYRLPPCHPRGGGGGGGGVSRTLGSPGSFLVPDTAWAPPLEFLGLESGEGLHPF